MKKRTLFATAFISALTIGGSSFAYTGTIERPHALSERPSHTYTIAASGASDEVVKGAANFIESVSKRGLKFLSNKSLSQAQRKKEFRSLLNDSFDLKTIGRFALGRYWRVATPDQRKEYLNLFEEMVIDTYAKRFGEYQGQDLVIGTARPIGKGDAVVNSKILSNGGPEVSIDWRVRYKNGQYNVIDVLVEGVSMSLTQRSEFSSIIQRGGGNVSVLIDKLNSR